MALTYLCFAVRALACVLAAALALGRRPRPVWLWLAAQGIVLVVVVWILRLSSQPGFGYDYGLFWRAGRDVWAGLDPYEADRFAEHPFLNPPTALPLFAAFAVLPLRLGMAAWAALNVAACVALPLLAYRALRAQEAPRGPAPPWQLSGAVLAALGAALAISSAGLHGVLLGQFGVLEAVALLAALLAQARGRPVWAGAALALATVKAPTMLPFLLLFLRPADWRAWVSLAVVSLALCLAAGSPLALPGRALTLLERIRELQAPGLVNDYSFEGPKHADMIGFAHAFYRVGLRDRMAIDVAQYAAVLLLGAWVAWQVLARARLGRAAACSLVALYSPLFLYHRSYDTVILAAPLVYCAAQARLARGAARYLFVACGVVVLLVLYVDANALEEVARLSFEAGAWGWPLQALVLPCVTWLIVLAMVLLVWGARTRARSASKG